MPTKEFNRCEKHVKGKICKSYWLNEYGGDGEVEV